MTSAALEQLVAEIDRMDLEQLRELWRERYGAPPPLRSVPVMRMQLAWRVQADLCGGLDKATRRLLARSGPVEAEGKHLGHGATLSRTWKGRHVEVVVVEEGFRWNGKTYPSLSATATAMVLSV